MPADQSKAKHVRTRRLTASLDLAGKGIEYGPLDKPILTKPEHAVSYVDFADREHLASQHRDNENRDVDNIPEIDIVTEGRLISEFLPEASVDYVIASHVMEHVPDLLGWLNANLSVLQPGGRIALAYPDKRHTFDIKRNTSTVSDIIAASLEKPSRPTLGQMADQVWNATTVRAADSWNGVTTAENAPYLHTREKALEILRARSRSDQYFDTHCWIFTDAEFLEMMQALRPLSEYPFEVVSFLPTQRGQLEFFVSLERI